MHALVVEFTGKSNTAGAIRVQYMKKIEFKLKKWEMDRVVVVVHYLVLFHFETNENKT